MGRAVGRAGRLAGIWIALSCAVATESALADCLPGMIEDGRTPVSCTGTSTAFVAGTDDIDLTVATSLDTVEAETGDAQAILLNAGSTITNNGDITATIDAGQNAIVIGDDASIINNNSITGDQSAIVIGNNATITNSGTITGGSDAIVFTGMVSTAANTVENLSGGVITTAAGAAIVGSVGTENINLRDGSTVIGDINLFGASDVVTVESSATVNGNIDLGDGDDQLILEDGAETTGNVQAGNGNDTITLRGSSGGGSTLHGDIDLGDSEVPTGAGERNALMLEEGSFLDGSVTGGANDDVVDVGTDAIVAGDINLMDGADVLTIDSGATVNGNIDLGDGDDILRFEDGAVYTGDVRAGGGSDIVNLRGSSGGGSTMVGDIHLGESDLSLGGGDKNVLKLRSDSFLTGDVIGGAADDSIEIGSFARIDGAINLGDGKNSVIFSFDGILNGNVTGGSGEDTVRLSSRAVMTGNLDLGAGADLLEIFINSTLDGTVDLGDDNDTLDYDPSVSVTGTIDLGDGNDTFILRPLAVLPSATVLEPGLGSDTLRLGSDQIAIESAINQRRGIIDLFEANQFENLVIGPTDFNEAFDWEISTSALTEFQDSIVLQTGALIYDGTVQLKTPTFSQQPNSAMFFILGQGIENSFLDLRGALELVPLDPADDPGPTELGASVAVSIDGILIEGDYTLIRTTDGITGSFDEVLLPTLATFTFSTAFVDVDMDMNIDEFVFTATRIFTYDNFARSASERNTGRYLDDARLNSGMSSFDEVFAALDLLPADELTTALAQLHAEGYDAHTSNILSWGRVQQQELQQRSMRCERFQYAPLPDVVTEDPCGSGGFMPWAKVIGNFGQNSPGFDRGYDSIAVGALVGVDYKWNENLWISGSMGYGTVEIEHDGGADSSFKSVDVGIAAGTVRGPLSVRGSFTYSHGFHNIDRDVDFRAARLEGQYDSDRISLALGAGYRFKVGPIVIEPNASIDYSHVEEEAVKEKGDAEIALDLEARQTDIVSGTAGLRFSANILKYRYVGELLEWADGLWMPSVTAQWRQAFVGFDRNFSARMQGAPSGAGSFKSKASDASGGVEVGAHLSFQPMKSANTIEFGYDGFFGDDVTNHSANVSVRIPF